MLFLILQLGHDRYAVEAGRVVEVLPVVNVRPIPNAPAGVAGMFDYHGQPTPLIDLTELALGTPSRRWMSTRILIVNYGADSGGSRVLGLLAEQVTEMLSRSPADFADTGVLLNSARYLGPVTTHAGSLVQRIEVQNLLSGTVRRLLSGEPAGEVW
jgi:chemotaxis-related protein WspB